MKRPSHPEPVRWIEGDSQEGLAEVSGPLDRENPPESRSLGGKIQAIQPDRLEWIRRAESTWSRPVDERNRG